MFFDELMYTLSVAYKPRNESVWLQGIDICSFSRYSLIFPKLVCTNLHSHQQCMRVSVAPHSCQHFVLSVFLNLTLLVEGVSNIICNLNYTFTNFTNKHNLIYLLNTWISFKKLPVQVSCSFFCVSLLCIDFRLGIRVLSHKQIDISNIFSCMACLIAFKMLPLMNKSLTLMKSNLSMFLFLSTYYFSFMSNAFLPLSPLAKWPFKKNS